MHFSEFIVQNLPMLFLEKATAARRYAHPQHFTSTLCTMKPIITAIIYQNNEHLYSFKNSNMRKPYFHFFKTVQALKSYKTRFAALCHFVCHLRPEELQTSPIYLMQSHSGRKSCQHQKVSSLILDSCFRGSV